ncbi:NADPH-dependent 7-cyano-7-deazaguanine reductase QueF [Rhodoferax sp.]|uniref:NADPH-dependent 7-cyano-7-deazaguanine reductase QueF n=1 Tax=Rhodoferax sp. TaxID=50421 RepID=UPI00262F7D61|nr:NADPH-dependent 7-cyano-7-deazaguanine reductase QueF [Rhodoferax sp.]MDD2918937.1 NADPH-dependent 7-cyano-7-deazaguanine reductase QueF [Rhodoferax sp.]
MSTPNHSPLGHACAYADQHDASILFPIARAPQRADLGIGATLPFLGADLWTAYELSWLNARGKPQVALAHLTVPCESVNLIESKSLKLYLGSFNNTRFADATEVAVRLRTDLTEAAWRGGVVQSSVGVNLVTADVFDREPIYELDGLSLDRLDLDCDRYTPAPELLSSVIDEAPVSEVLTSNLLRSNCPVTGQPDWGSVQISYFGPQIDQAGLLRYLISFRNHQGFHEDCVERMFMDIMARCRPHKLSVYARYTRRGGLDINPFRTSHPQALPPNHRNARQ